MDEETDNMPQVNYPGHLRMKTGSGDKERSVMTKEQLY